MDDRLKQPADISFFGPGFPRGIGADLLSFLARHSQNRAIIRDGKLIAWRIQ
jgi:hypothetical protein